MKKHVRLDHKQLSTARPRPQQMCWRGNSRWVLVAALCIVTFLGMLGIASAAQHSGGPLTLAQKEQRIQQLLDAGRAHLRPKPTTPQVPSPQPAPTLHAGIINMQQGPFGGSLFAVNNFWQVVLTRESGEGKLEEVDILHEGNRPCKRHNEHLRKSSNWKRCSW